MDSVTKYTSTMSWIQFCFPWFEISLDWRVPDFDTLSYQTGLTISWGRTYNTMEMGGKAYQHTWQWMHRVTKEQLQDEQTS